MYIMSSQILLNKYLRKKYEALISEQLGARFVVACTLLLSARYYGVS